MGRDRVVYTAIFDDYDVLTDPEEPSPGIDYLCFTDAADVESEVWTPVVVESEDLSPAELNRAVKILPHEFLPSYDASLYVDGNVKIRCDVARLFDDYLVDRAMVLPPHPNRNCVYEEANACIEAGKGDPEVINDQMRRYRRRGFPEGDGLPENSMLLRRHHAPAVKKTMETWWEEFRRGSNRDQLSFAYAAWETGFDYRLLPTPIIESDCFVRYPHRPQDWRDPLWKYWVHVVIHRYDAIPYTACYYACVLLSVVSRDGPTEALRRTADFVRKRV
ncbi:MAG: hypothetical protein ACI8XM_000848 [Haloarculaceae archaeon]|jgi:hypothetical protein